jgi:hypothetical protein
VTRTYRLGPSRRALNRLMTVLLGWGIGPAFAAAAGDPVEDFVAEAPRHPVFALGE